MLTVKIIPDLFKPDGRQEFLLTYPEGRDLYLSFLVDEEAYRKAGLDKKGIAPKDFVQACDVWYRGSLVHPDDYAQTRVEDCTEICLFPRPGWSTVVTAVWSAVKAFGKYLISTDFLVSLAVSVVTSAIYWWLFAPESPNFERGNKNYGWEGVKTEYSTIGTMVPVVYGRVVTGGKCISQRIYANENNDQVLDLLLLLGEGEIRGIRKQDDSGVCASTEDPPWIKLDGNFIDNLSGVGWDYRLGTLDQTAIARFDQISVNYVDSQVLSQDWYTISNAGGGGNFDTVEFNFALPAGLYITGKTGVHYHYVEWNIEKKEEPSGDWEPGQSGTWIDCKTGPFYKTVKLEGLGNKPYSFRMRRYRTDYTGTVPGLGETIRLDSYNRLSYFEAGEGLAYPGSALVAITAVATDQISTAQPNIETKVDGRKLRYFDGNDWLAETWGDEDGSIGRNPAWQIHDLIYNEVYGLGPYFDDTLKASAKFKDLADYADQLVDDGSGSSPGEEKRFLSDVIIDGVSDPWDLLKELLRSCHSFPLVVGAQIWPVVERECSPCMSFGMDNVASDEEGKTSLVETWRTLEDTPNCIEVQYFDLTKDSVREVIQFPDDDSLFAAGEKIRKLALVFHNVTRRSQAARLAKYHWLIVRNIKRFIQFSTSEEAIALQPGDVFYFSHDIPQFDYSGKIFRVRDVDNAVELDNAWDGVDEVHPGNYRILIRDLDDDAIEIRDVQSIATENNRHIVTYVDQSYGFTPAERDPYILVEDTQTPIKYVCVELTRDDKMRRVISAQEYNPDIFSYIVEDVEPIDYSDLPNPLAPPPAPTDLTLTEMPERIGFFVNVAEPVSTAYDHCRIFLSTEGTYWDEIGRTKEVKNFRVTEVMPGAKYWVKVASYNRYGTPCATPPTGSITLTGYQLPPKVRGLEVFGQGNDNEFVGKDCKIQWKLATLFLGLGAGELGDEGGGLGETQAQYIKDTKVSVYVGDVEKRTEYVAAPGKTYTYGLEKNIEDNGSAQRTIEFRLWYRDNYNQLSAKYASLEVVNSAPSMGSGTPTIIPIYGGLKIEWGQIKPTHHDLTYFALYCGTDNPPTTLIGNFSAEQDYEYVEGLDADTTYYVKLVPHDPYGVGTASLVASGSPAQIPQPNIEDLSFSIRMSDSDDNTQETLATLYDGNKGSGGVSYVIPSGEEKWVQYLFPMEEIIDSVLVCSGGSVSVYVGYSTDGQTWSWLRGPLDGEGKLQVASNQTDAQNNPWSLTSETQQFAKFPNGVTARYCKFYIQDSLDLYELVFRREIIAEQIIADNLSAISANLGTVTAGKLETVQIVASNIQTSNQDVKKVIITPDGITLHVTGSVGKYGTNFKYGDGTKYGTGARAYMHHSSHDVPFYIAASANVADMHMYNRGATPTGPAEVGDLCIVNNQLYRCTTTGTPGVWKRVSVD